MSANAMLVQIINDPVNVSEKFAWKHIFLSIINIFLLKYILVHLTYLIGVMFEIYDNVRFPCIHLKFDKDFK